jgi:fibronectin-binding autotransporter adhesin
MNRNFDGVVASSVRSRLQMLHLAAGAAVTLGSLAGTALGQTWIGATGNFNTNANWLGNSAPLLGTVTTPVNLNFFSGNAGAVTATNNVGTPWVSSSLTFNTNNAFTLACGANSFQMQSSPTVSMNGLSNATVSVTGTGNALVLTDNLVLNGNGPGNLFLGGGITESGGAHSVTIGAGPARDQRIFYLGNGSTGNNTFTGGLILDGGTVGGSASAAGSWGNAGSTMTVTGNGGTLAMIGTVNSSLGVLQVNGPLHMIGTGSLGLFNSTVSTVALQGSGTIYNNSSGTISVMSNQGTGATSPFTGAVVCDQSELPEFAVNLAGNITLSAVGANAVSGSLNQAASFDIRAGGTLSLLNNISDSLQNGDRVGDTTPVRLRSGKFTLNGPATAVTTTSGHNFVPTNLTEKIGDLSGAGNNTVTLSPTNGTSVITTLQPNSLVRGTERGTFNFRTGNGTLGDGASANRGRIMLTNPLAGTEFVGGGGGAGSQNISILPYAVGGTSTTDSGSSLITYGADGFRLLNTSTEYYSTDLAPGDTTANVRITGSIGNGLSTTMNALVLGAGASTDGSVTGSGTLNITSGVVLAAGTHGTTAIPNSIANNIAFGGAEGVIYTAGINGLKITGQLTGTNGLTRSSDGVSGSPNTLYLSADNSGLHGLLTLDGGVLQYSATNALPGDTSIVANGSNVQTTGNSVGLNYAGAAATTLNRPIQVDTGMLSFKLLDASISASSQPNIGNLTLSGAITGVGGVNYQAQLAGGTVTTAGDIYVTGTNNTYTGVTRFAGGNVHVYADGSLGSGGPWEFAGGNIVLENGDQTNSRRINVSGTSTIFNTNGFNLTLTGPMSGINSSLGVAANAGFIKNGAGTLTLTNTDNTVAGAVQVNAGTLLINGNLGASATNSAMANNGGTLGGSGTIYRNTWGYVKTGSGSTSSPFVYTGGGIVAPGSNGPGILTVWGALDLAPAKVAGGTAPNVIGTPAASGSTLSMELNGPVAGSGYDQVQTFLQNASPVPQVLLGDGSATWAASLSLSLGYAPSASDVFWLIVNTNQYQANLGTANTTTGTFAGLPEGSSVTLGTFGGNTYTGTISYKGDFDSNNPAAGSGNDVVIYNVVPAPGSIALLGIGGLLATRRKRRTA